MPEKSSLFRPICQIQHLIKPDRYYLLVFTPKGLFSEKAEITKKEAEQISEMFGACIETQKR